MFSKNLGFLGFGSYFQRTKGSGSWLMFLEDGFLDPGLCFSEDLRFLGFGSCFQRTKGFGSWLMFSEDQGFFGL